MFQTAGAHVIFGDWAADKGRSLEAELTSGQSAEAGNVHFQQLDVRDYSSQVALFDLAHQKYGCVDVAVSCAAVGEPGGWFEPKVLDLESVRKVRRLRHRLRPIADSPGTFADQKCY